MKYISEQTSNRICSHMNKDHIDSVYKYLKDYGAVENFKEAIMEKITSKYMVIKYDEKKKKIFFPEEISEAEVHKTLVSMTKGIQTKKSN